MHDELAARTDIDEARKRDVGAAASERDAVGAEHRHAPPAEEMQNAVAAAEDGGAHLSRPRMLRISLRARRWAWGSRWMPTSSFLTSRLRCKRAARMP